jgi:hypothetical protein
MITKYSNYITESLINGIILESRIKYKEDFKLMLRELVSDNNQKVKLIAYFLQDMFNKEFDISQNYIGLSDDSGKVAFTPDSKMKFDNVKVINGTVVDSGAPVIHPIVIQAGIPNKGLVLAQPMDFNRLGIPNEWKLIKKYDIDDYKGDYRDYYLYYLQNLKFPDKFVVCSQSKGNEDPIEPINDSSAEGKLKIGRYVNRLLDLYFKENESNLRLDRSKFNSSAIEDFVNAFVALNEFNKNAFKYFEVVKGEQIRILYSEHSYMKKTGELGQSCMRFDKCQEYFDIYVENPDVCSLLILKDPNELDKIHGRALLWVLSDGTKYMDRIYTTKQSIDIIFDKWREENGYREKYAEGRVSVNIKDKDYIKYPYMDTLKYYYPDDGILVSSPLGSSDGILNLEDTNGGTERF